MIGHTNASRSAVVERDASSPGLCRLCRRPSWGADDAGPVHPCCLAWRQVMAFGYPCPSCQVAAFVIAQLAAMAREGRQMAVRLPRYPPLPRFLPDGTPYVPSPGPVPRCAVCGWRMTVIVPGQHAHPLCAKDWAAACRRPRDPPPKPGR